MRQRATPLRRQAWAQAYLRTLIERDVHDIAHIEDATRLPQLLALTADLSGQIGLSSKTVEKYLGCAIATAVAVLWAPAPRRSIVHSR